MNYDSNNDKDDNDTGAGVCEKHSSGEEDMWLEVIVIVLLLIMILLIITLVIIIILTRGWRAVSATDEHMRRRLGTPDKVQDIYIYICIYIERDILCL